MKLPAVQSRLFEKIRWGRGTKGAGFDDYVRKIKFTWQILGNICRVHLLFMRKGAQENGLSSKILTFLLRNCVFSFWSTTFAENLPTWWHLEARCPPPLISTTSAVDTRPKSNAVPRIHTVGICVIGKSITEFSPLSAAAFIKYPKL